MSAVVADTLLRIAAAVAADGGAAVRRTLQAILREAAPFDAGEIVFVRAQGEHVHLPLGEDESPLFGADLVDHVLAHDAPYRIDDWPDAAPFVEGHGRLRARHLRSALVLPFRFEASPGPALAGVLGVARGHGWAYVGASLPLLVPLAGMAGLAVDLARGLSALLERAKALEAVSPWGASAVEGHRSVAEEALRVASHREQERDTARAASESARAAAEAARAEAESVGETLRRARNSALELLARAEGAEQRLLEAERARDDWAQQAKSLRTRLGEQDGELRSLQRAVAGARETAAAAADLAEAREARARELEALVRTLEGELRERPESPSLPPEEGPTDPPSAALGSRPDRRRARSRSR